jgi:hypothetical protein
MKPDENLQALLLRHPTEEAESPSDREIDALHSVLGYQIQLWRLSRSAAKLVHG